MSGRPTLLLYCQHSLGLGHLTRSWALAANLSAEFDVVLVSGGAAPAGLTPPPGLSIVQLPALAQDGDGHLVAVDGNAPLDEIRRERKRLLVDLYRRLQPQAVVLELFPFGRRKFHDELVALLAETQRTPRPVVATSVRDLLVNRGAEQQKHDDRAADLLRRYFDVVLVHTDPQFAMLSDTFTPSRPLQLPVHHTGFVVPERSADVVPAERSGILVSGGGGRFADALYALALDAHALLGAAAPPMTIVAGPLCLDETIHRLRAATSTRAGVRIERTVDDLCGAMQRAAVSVSQCGYNTALDILRARVPAIVVPFEENGDSEQLDRAHRLERVQVVRVIRGGMGARALAEAIDAACRSAVPPAASFDVQGGARSTAILIAAVNAREPSSRASALETV
jgi:predicted glycosyltransferase